LRDGNSTEDLVFVNSPHPVDEIEVSLVELYVSVFDSKGQPAEDVSSSDFRVLEDGEVQEIRRFEAVEERPIHAGVLLDVSTSMTESLEEAEKAALRFFESVLRPRDRASLIVFSDSPQLVVPFTNDLERLAGGLAGLVPDGGTSLHDSLIFALHSFAGLRGRRALILISDGEDSSSDYRFEEALEYSRRAGVAIYTIGLRISNRETQVRNKLTRLAGESGGRSFFIESAQELGRVYDKVEIELRSQFLLTYQSSSTARRDLYREVEIDLQKKGRKAKTIQGYYP
jgi:Ca-activated chloride channel family protein